MFLYCSAHLGCSPLNYSSYTTDAELEFIRCNECVIIWRSPGSRSIIPSYSSAYFESKKYLHNRKHKVKKSGWLIDIALKYHPEIRSLLEIGCSLGNTLDAANQRKIENLGIDISSYAVGFCKSIGLNAENKTLQDLMDEHRKFARILSEPVN